MCTCVFGDVCLCVWHCLRVCLALFACVFGTVRVRVWYILVFLLYVLFFLYVWMAEPVRVLAHNVMKF